MMTLGQYIVFITFMLPAFSATVGGVLVALSVRYSLTARERSVKCLFLAYFSAMAFAWVSMFFFYHLPEAFVYTNSLTMFCLSVQPVIFYHFFWLMVNQVPDKRTRFNYWHYLAPVLISLVLLVWSLTVPADVRLEMIEGRRLFVPDGLEIYAMLFFSKPEMNFLFGIIYMVMTIRLLLRYYVIIEGNKYTLRKPQGWVLLLIGATLCVLPAAALGSILPRESAYASGAMMLSVGLLVMQHIVLTTLWCADGLCFWLKSCLYLKQR